MKKGSVFGRSVSPGENKRDHVAGVGGGEVHGGVSDIGNFAWFEIPLVDDVVSHGGIGFLREAFLMAHDLIEEMVRKKLRDDFRGMLMRFVREDRQRVFVGMKVLEKFKHTRINQGSGLPVLGVVPVERGENFLSALSLVPKSQFHERSGPVTNETLDGFLGVSGQSSADQCFIDAGGDSGKGVDEGSVEVENEAADHGESDSVGW